ncbi:hypothetical protein EDD17DRAFT_1873930 [Pisolithus thermaeus]|nr:hypothetical protein EDD17DRAFT_1873930 [Pisolithus thermaeus]
MVSPLWSACSEGNIEAVLSLLNQASPVDIEIKDHTGATPLLEAVKKGHVDVVKALLAKGADPSVVTNQDGPKVHAFNPEIIDLLNNASAKTVSEEVPAQDPTYPQDPNADPSKRYYPLPAHPYGYYPPVPTLPDGSPAYYQGPPVPVGENNGFGNLPPPEVARYIPCRFYPACRYGSSCIFAHPQGPYYPGPPPPAQYSAPFDPMVQQQYAHSYYTPPPPPSYPSAPVPHLNPVSPPSGPVHTPPHPPMVHTRSGSEALSPVQTPFSPASAPPAPYPSMSPVSYPPPPPPHPLQPHPLPLSIPSLPPSHQPIIAHGPQSPQSAYPNGPTSAPPFSVRQDPSPYPPQSAHVFSEINGGPKSPPVRPQADNYGPPPAFRQGANHHRRGSMRRGSFAGSRKPAPACLFYPAGRCRNGDDCRFPHVMPIVPGPQHHGPPRPRDGSNGINTIEERFATLTVREEIQPPRNGTTNSSRSQSTDAGNRSRGAKPMWNKADRKPIVKQQRVPNADEFPVLGGVASSKNSVNGGPTVNGSVGPTAAQVLQAPPPARKDPTKESTTRSTSPEERQAKTQVESRPVESNGIQANGTASSTPSKLPVSFAAAATSVADIVKEVSVPA